MFYPIKQISGIVASAVGLSPRQFGCSVRQPPCISLLRIAYGRWIVTQHCLTKLTV